VTVIVDVIAPVIVAAVHVNVNATVIVIRPVDEQRRADKTRCYAIARGSPMEFGVHLDVMKIDEDIDDEHDAVGVGLLERVVVMRAEMLDP
jgi:hypothetical protein